MELRPDLRLVIASLTGGGSERVCQVLASEWAARGLRVEILVVKAEGEFLGLLHPAVVVRSARAARTRGALWWLRRELVRWPGVPALLFGFDFGFALGAMKRLGVLPVPLVYREGSFPEHNVPTRAHWGYRWGVNGVDAVVAQTEAARESLARLGVDRGKTVVVWNPLPEARHEPAGWNRAASGVTLLAAGRLSPEKGFLRLIEAFAGLARTRPDARLIIAGQGRQRDELIAAAERCGVAAAVSFPGFISDIRPLYRTAQLFVLSSHYEGQPNVLLEALREGCRPVAAGGAGVRETLGSLGLGGCWLENERFGMDFPAAVERAAMLSDEQLRHALGELARRTAPNRVSDSYSAIARAVRASRP